jgi:hypothetical protein
MFHSEITRQVAAMRTYDALLASRRRRVAARRAGSRPVEPERRPQEPYPRSGAVGAPILQPRP